MSVQECGLCLDKPGFVEVLSVNTTVGKIISFEVILPVTLLERAAHSHRITADFYMRTYAH
jgi:hypothetical protein